MIQFDESYFELKLKGGITSTDLIQVEAYVLKGTLIGQQLPLKCKWFNVSKANDFFEIEGVTGQFYQPCIEDVDTKIMIQAIPILDQQEYQGMPVYIETTFLVLDPQIQQSVNHSIQTDGYLVIDCKCEHSYLTEIESPQDLMITLSEQEISILVTSTNQIIEYELQQANLNFKIIKKNNNQLDISINDKVIITVKVQNSLTRDIMYLMLKTFRGKATLGQLENNGNQKNHQDPTLYAKLSEYEETTQRKNKQIEKLQYDLSIERQANKKLSQNLLIVEKKLESEGLLIQSKDKLILEQEQLIKKNSIKLQFLEQEVNLLKTQVVQVENTNKKLSQQHQELLKTQEYEADKIKEMIFREKEEILNKNIKNLKEENSQLLANFEAQLKLISTLQEQAKGIQDEKEEAQNEMNSLKKKYESLAQEKTSIVSKGSVYSNSNKSATHSPKSEQGSQNIFNIREFELDSLERDKDDEIKHLKQQISNLEQTLKSMKIAYEQDIRARQEGRSRGSFGGSNSNMKEVQIQKIVYINLNESLFQANSLAETLTEKEIVIENSKRINRDLMKKINQLEDQLRQKSEQKV